MRSPGSWFFVLAVLAMACGSVYVQPPAPLEVDVPPSESSDASGTATAAPEASASAVVIPTAATASTSSSASPSASVSASTSAAVIPVPSATASAGPSATAPGVATVVNDTIELSSPLSFETGSARLRIQSGLAIDEIAALLRQRTDLTLVRVEVHTDSDGDDKANLKLSDERAMTIARAIRGAGIDCKRVIAVGFGETRPLAPNDSPQNKAKNRRITLAIATLRGRPVGGRPVDGGGHVAGDPCQ